MDDLWQRITLAFLHDPPCKVYDFGKSHEEVARGFINNCNADVPLDWESFGKLSQGGNPDHAAAASDRIIFPKGKLCAEKFSGMIRHPLSGAQLQLELPPSLGMAIEMLQNSLGGIHAATWQDFYFLLWRRWREGVILANNPQQNGPGLAMLPADTRLPDHSIWEHMNLTSAFEACRSYKNAKIEPAFLLFQLGPVQEFIATAKKTSDLWSGSYLLSFMMAKAMKAVSDEIGPCSVIFPNLCGQGVFDLANKEIFDRITYTGKNGEDTLWQRIYDTMGHAPDQEMRKKAFNRLWEPTLPNRFLALVPAERAEELAQLAERAIKSEWGKICDHCFERLCKATDEAARYRERWEKQIGDFWQITYQTMPFFATADAAMEALAAYPDGELKKN
ncbi:MAG: type III-B CRISPR-associated protein Cas10/Cmr2, partial [Victivallaceae bacterium]